MEVNKCPEQDKNSISDFKDTEDGTLAPTGKDATTSGSVVNGDCHDVIDELFPTADQADLCLSDMDTEMAESVLFFDECFPSLEEVFAEEQETSMVRLSQL